MVLRYHGDELQTTLAREASMESARVYMPDDLGSKATLADLYPVYRALREGSPVRFLRTPAGVFPGDPG